MAQGVRAAWLLATIAHRGLREIMWVGVDNAVRLPAEPHLQAQLAAHVNNQPAVIRRTTACWLGERVRAVGVAVRSHPYEVVARLDGVARDIKVV